MKTFKTFAIIASIILFAGCNTNKIEEEHIETRDIYSLDNVIPAKMTTKELKPKEKTFNYHIVDDKTIEENFYKQRIPKEFCDAFLYYTRKFPEIRMPFYSIMVHESGNFKVYKRKNVNGSYDLGPSHLNTNNIKNAYFRKLYNPTDESHITTVYCFYMVMSINYFYDMCDKFNWNYTDAFYAYNGGQKAPSIIKSNYIPKNKQSYVKNVKAYARAVNKNIDKYSEEFAIYKADIQDQINTGLAYIKENQDNYQNFSDVYIVFNEKGELVMNLVDNNTIAFSGADFDSDLIKQMHSNIIVNIRREDYFLYLIEKISVIG